MRRAHETLYKQEVRKVMSITNDSGGMWPASPCLIGRVLFKVMACHTHDPMDM